MTPKRKKSYANIMAKKEFLEKHKHCKVFQINRLLCDDCDITLLLKLEEIK